LEFGTYDPGVSRSETPDESLLERIAELERDRELLNAIANNAPSLICLLDAEGRVRPLATNKAFEQTLGYEPAETGGALFWERYVPPGDADEVRTAIETAIRTGRIRERDGRWVARDGRIVQVSWSCVELPMIASGPLFLVCGTDITERKRTEEEVRESRARIVAAADEARKRLERNLHDGAQQRLIAMLLSFRFARGKLPEDSAVAQTLDNAIDEATAALHELRELARGIHPAVLTDQGLAPALRSLVKRAPLPVTLDMSAGRLDEQVEAAVYYIVSEALANVAKYANASSASVNVERGAKRVVVAVEDDGIGGADPSRGTGLRGLADRVAALDGTLTAQSPAGGGTRVRAEIPLSDIVSATGLPDTTIVSDQRGEAER
jgi:PAS domain S-box-containing protein